MPDTEVVVEQQELDLTSGAAKHVAIVHSDIALERRLDSFRGEPFTYSARQLTWEHKRRYLVLFVGASRASAGLRWLGAVEVTRRTSDIDRNLEVYRVSKCEPALGLSPVLKQLGSQGRRVGAVDGPLSDKLGPRVVDALRALRPAIGMTIDELMAPRGRVVGGDEGERLAHEKDAAGVILDIALTDARDQLVKWTPVPLGVPFLRGVENRAVHEDRLIERDAGRFEDWVAADTGDVEWRTFSEGGRRVHIANVNNSRVEHSLGVDLVYFNEASRSFVLVQYKKMTRGRDGKRWYRGDQRLESQLERMRKVDSDCATVGGDFRLYPRPCFVKLCEPCTLVSDSKALIPGLYLAREHFEQLWTDASTEPKSGKGRRLGPDNLERHLANTQFTDLVKGGWIGSRGAATEDLSTRIRSIIRGSIDAGRSPVVGIQPGDSTSARQASHR